jgi:hypothetical protein
VLLDGALVYRHVGGGWAAAEYDGGGAQEKEARVADVERA